MRLTLSTDLGIGIVTIKLSTVFPMVCLGPIVMSRRPQEPVSKKLMFCFTYTGMATRLGQETHTEQASVSNEWILIVDCKKKKKKKGLHWRLWYILYFWRYVRWKMRLNTGQSFKIGDYTFAIQPDWPWEDWAKKIKSSSRSGLLTHMLKWARFSHTEISQGQTSSFACSSKNYNSGDKTIRCIMGLLQVLCSWS